jgi:hypothetical protein
MKGDGGKAGEGEREKGRRGEGEKGRRGGRKECLVLK